MNSYQYAIKLLSRRNYHPSKLKNKLLMKGYHQDEIDASIDVLKSKGLINENDFIKRRIEVLLKKGLHHNFVKRTLKIEGLEADETLINEIKEEQQLTSEDQVKKIVERKWLKKLTGASSSEDKMKIKRRMQANLMRLGHRSFDY